MSELHDTDAVETPAETATAPFPWPPPEGASVIVSFTDTWRGAVFSAREFFRSMPDGHTGAAVLYYLVVGVLVAAIQLFWSTLLPLGPMLPFEAADGVQPLTSFLLSPVYLLVSLLIAAGATHLLVLVLVPQQRGFATTLRVFCFAYSPMLFVVVPRLGDLVGFVWMIVIAITGIREAHRTSTGRAATAVLVPLVIAVVMVIFAVLAIAAGALLAA